MKKRERRSSFHVGCALWIALGCAAFAPLACSGDDTTPAPSTGTGGTGGMGGSGGGGGGGAAGSDATSGAQCGGFASLRCPESDLEFCDYDDKSGCGAGDIMGVCQPRPAECTDDGPEVCGCNGKLYGNACKAQQDGTDSLPPGMGSCFNVDSGTLR